MGYNGDMRRPVGRSGKSEFLRVRITGDVLSALRRLAEADDRTVSGLVRKILRDFLERRGR